MAVKKVLITTDWGPSAVNGVAASVRALTQGLEALGVEVRILTLSNSCRSRVEGNTVYLGSVGVGRIYPNARLRSAFGSRYIRELVRWRPDIVHSQCEFSTFFLARQIARECGCPLVHTYHTVYEDFTHYFSPSVRLGKYMAAELSRRILAQTDLVIAPTGKVKAMLEGYGVAPPVAVIPSGLEAGRLLPVACAEREAMRRRFGIREGETVLLYLGRLAKEKNVEELIGFAARLPEGVHLAVAGDGPSREALERQAQGRVIFTGMAPPQEVARYYSLGDIFVSASQSETQGLTYIEAMACGLPLLCRRDPCLEGVLREGENGFAYCGEEDFLEKLALLLDDERRRRMGRAAQGLAVGTYSALGFAGRLLREYGALLRQARAAA